MTDDKIREIERNTEKAKDSLRELKEATEFGLDCLERVGKFSKRTASVGFGASVGVVLGIFCVVLTSGSRFQIPERYQNWLIFGMGLGSASAGALFIRESGEEKARRLEAAATKIGDNPSMAGFKQNILEEHTLVTRANAGNYLTSFRYGPGNGKSTGQIIRCSQRQNS